MIQNADISARQGSTPLFRSIPLAVWAVAVMVGLLHMAPYWRLQHKTPPGWTFTGTRSASPDMMQYRVWMRQSQQEGVFVSNRFTSEPNKPHLPVPFYYAVGKIATLTGARPEWVFACAGATFAFLLTLVLFVTVQRFFGSKYQAWWVFGVLMLGGGLGGHLKFLSEMRWAQKIDFVKRTLIDWFQWPVFEDYRSHYIFITLFDGHFSLFWLFTMLSVLALYVTVTRFSLAALAATMALSAATTFLHVYEGVTLVVIAAGVALVCWCKRLAVRPAVVSLAAMTATVAVTLGWLLHVHKNSGLPLPDWRAVNILFATLLISYPVAWGLIAWGIASYWKEADLDRCFLLGWALGCTALTLSGPFYPYPDRGTMTMQVPLYLIAGGIYFARYARVSLLATVVVVLLLGATPAWVLKNMRRNTQFRDKAHHMFINQDHRRLIDLLKQRASVGDVLLTDKTEVSWRTDDLWLVPEYPGVQYCGHFFLTVDYDRKQREVTDFYHEIDAGEQADFLAKNKVRFVFVGPELDRARFDRVPGLKPMEATAEGVLYEYVGQPSDSLTTPHDSNP